MSPATRQQSSGGSKGLFPQRTTTTVIITASESKAESAELRSFDSIFSLKGKVAVITGGSRGLGLHTASGFLQAGASKVYILARTATDLEEATEALNNLQASNKQPDARAIPIKCDLSTAAGCAQAAEEVGKTTDHIDILIANAAATYIGDFEQTSGEDFAHVMNINVNSVFHSVQKFTPLLVKGGTVNDPSRVVMVSSVAGVVVGDMGQHGTYAYATSKAAIIHLMHNLAVELGPRHISVNVVAPGTIPSKMSERLMARNGGIEAYAKQVPDQKLGTKEDIAGTMVFMASPAARHINGATLVLDGGSFLVRGCA